jgi:lysophospholipase L1-like esterase
VDLAFDLLIIALAIVLGDVFVRAFLLFRLNQKIDAKGDYLQHNHILGKGKLYTIALLGASSIYGEGTSVKVPFAGTLAQRLAKQGHKVVVHNRAMSGHRVADIVHEQLPKLGRSDLIVVYAGTKDCLMFTPTAKYYSDLQLLAQALNGKAVVWVTIQDPRLLWILPVWMRWLFYFRAKQFTMLLKQTVTERADEHWRIVDFFAEGLQKAGHQGLTKRQLFSDGIHLSDAGQYLISEMVAKAVRQLPQLVP